MRLRGYPVIVLALALLAAAMLLPALVAAVDRDWRSARLFLYAGVFCGFVAAIVGAASHDPGRGEASARSELLTILGGFTLLPVFAAAPFWLMRPDLGYAGSYFESVSAITTTGATLLDRPQSTERALQLWRAMLGWAGGFGTLVSAAAILIPRNLLETPEGGGATVESLRAGRVMGLGPGGPRTLRAAQRILPVYLGLTAALTIALATTGSSSFVALSHAMGVISTSGISPLDGGFAALDNRWSEAVALVFMIAAASRAPYLSSMRRRRRTDIALRDDPEMRLFALTIFVASSWLFLRHWVGALTLSNPVQGLEDSFTGGLVALWGALMTCVSFLSTTGYASADWVAARSWSGLDTPAMMLLGLAAMGGGVASTAGGIKLFRAYALFRHSSSEIARLVHPHMVDTARTEGGRLTRTGVVNGWIFMMLFLTGIGVAVIALTLFGVKFDIALISAIAALTNTGPVFPLITGDTAAYRAIGPEARMILCAAMILGRVEVLAVIALLNPSYWTALRLGSGRSRRG